jgi:hypothetical protein
VPRYRDDCAAVRGELAGIHSQGKKMKTMVRLLAAGLLMFVLAGCQSALMTKSVAHQETVAPNTATVVFLRPSSFGGAIQSSVYDVTGGSEASTQFGGIVSSKTQVVMHLQPGPHRLMVIAENADFLETTLTAGKTYYVLVMPRMGVWKARFSLIPIHNDPAAKYSLASTDFASWMKSCNAVETTPAAEAWYSENKSNIDAKRVDYMQKWNRMDPADKAQLTLHAQDGV